MLGRSEAELTGLTLRDVTHPDDLQGAAGFAALGTDETQRGTLLTRVVHQDGSARWLELHFTLFREGDGAVGVAVVGDVTERIRESEQLRRSEEHLRIAVQVAEMGMWSWDVGSDEVRWNAKHFELFGMAARPGPLTSEAFERHVHPGDRDWVMGRLQRAVADRLVFQAEFRTVTDGGEVRWMSGYGRATATSPGGETSQMSGVMFDATERKEAEAVLRDLNETLERRMTERTEALAQSERRFARAFFANPIPACMTTLGEETFVEVNDSFLRLTGYERAEVVGRTVFELGVWSSRNDQRKLTDALARGRGFLELDLHLLDKAGGAHDILLSAEPVPLGGHDGYLKMFYDVTVRKESEARVHRAIREVMSDTSWFSQRVVERLAQAEAGDAAHEPVALSRREREVLECLAQGMNNDAIAQNLGIATQTVRNYISTVYDKLEVHTRGEAIVWARERGITGGRPER